MCRLCSVIIIIVVVVIIMQLQFHFQLLLNLFFTIHFSTYVRFGVLRVVKPLMMVFWIVIPCRLAGRYQSFGEMLVSANKSTQCYNSEDE